MLRKTVILLVVAIVACGSAYAQKSGKGKSREEMRKELREFKLKFIAQEMDLKEDQQKQFAEVYCKMEDERMKLFEQTRGIERKLKKEGEVSDEEYVRLNKTLTETKEKDAEIEKRYDGEFSKFLSGKQIFKMKSAEDKFRQKMAEMRHKKKSKK
ncbi:MAG: hypothetical protein K2M93_03315 [Muribaculaceae bacterium]|nr:hypothetical protein [Muribaculaceae bacterium]